MFGTIATATQAAAPHVGRAVVAGGKALAGFAITTKLGAWSRNQGVQALTHLDDSVGDARVAVEERKQSKPEVDWSNIEAVKETA